MGVLVYIFSRGRTEVIQHSVACTPEIVFPDTLSTTDIKLFIDTKDSCFILYDYIQSSYSDPYHILNTSYSRLGKRREMLKDAFKKDAKFVKWWNKNIAPTIKDSYEDDYRDSYASHRWNFVAEFIQELIFAGDIIEESKLIQMVSVRLYNDSQHDVIIRALKLVKLYKDN